MGKVPGSYSRGDDRLVARTRLPPPRLVPLSEHPLIVVCPPPTHTPVAPVVVVHMEPAQLAALEQLMQRFTTCGGGGGRAGARNTLMLQQLWMVSVETEASLALAAKCTTLSGWVACQPARASQAMKNTLKSKL